MDWCWLLWSRVSGDNTAQVLGILTHNPSCRWPKSLRTSPGVNSDEFNGEVSSVAVQIFRLLLKISERCLRQAVFPNFFCASRHQTPPSPPKPTHTPSTTTLCPTSRVSEALIRCPCAVAKRLHSFQSLETHWDLTPVAAEMVGLTYMPLTKALPTLRVM